jgi:HlyD family secretion protein
LLENLRVWKWLFGTVVVICISLAAGGYYLVSSGKLKEMMAGFRPDAQGMKVRLETATKGNLIRTVSAPGLIEPRTKVSISAQVSARVIALPFREGQQVKKGEVVVRLDAVDLSAALDSAKAGLKAEEARFEGAKASLINATSEFGRKKELFSSKDISKSELDMAEADFLRAQSNYNSALASIEIAKAAIQRAQKDLDNTVIAAPMDGVITTLNAEVGELVVVGTLNNPGSVIMEIADLTDLLVKAKIDEANIAPVRAGQSVKVYVNAMLEKNFSAVVERVKMIRENDRTDNTWYFETEMKLEVPDGVGLYSGMTCNVDIAVETFYDVLLVPSQAVLDRKTEEIPKSVLDTSAAADPAKKFLRAVYTIENGKAVSHPVSTGPSDLTRTVILSGVNPGDKVIIGPFKALLTLKDGQSLQEESAAPKVAPGQTSPASAQPTPPAEEKPAAGKSEGDAAAPKQEAGTR